MIWPCKVGRCRVCGKQVCIGTGLPTQDTVDDLLAKIYLWMYQIWKAPRKMLPDGISDFRDMFLVLFHKEDQGLVREWLSRPENQTIHQVYWNSDKEVW